MFDADDLIYSYSRRQAIEDGVLVDVTITAKEAGFRFPVALTRTVWERCVTVPTGVHGQDEAGRLWDVLFMLHLAIKLRNTNREGTPPLIHLKALCGPGDEGEPVITILRPDED